MVRQLSAFVCHGVVASRNNGMKQRDIANQYHITQGEVSKILKWNAVMSVPTPRPRPGRPIKATRRRDRLLVRLCCAGGTKTTSTRRTEWQNATCVPVSRKLVNNRLIKAGYQARRPIRKPLLK